MLGISMSKNGLLLGVFAVATAGALALTNLGTQDRIAAAERAAQQAILFEVLPKSQHDNDLLNDTYALPDSAREGLGLRDATPVYLGKRDGRIETVLITAIARDGYSGDIRIIVGVNRDQTISGVRVLAHKETPGLGDKIEIKKHQWILSFDGKSLTAPVIQDWYVKKDGGIFDQFAGATITPRAVVNKVRQVLEFVQANHAALFDASTTASTTTAEENTHE